jgi:hypothetical protein
MYWSISIIAGPRFLSFSDMMNFLSFFICRSRPMRPLSRFNIGGIILYVLKVSDEVVSNSLSASSISSGANGGSQSDVARSLGLYSSSSSVGGNFTNLSLVALRSLSMSIGFLSRCFVMMPYPSPRPRVSSSLFDGLVGSTHRFHIFKLLGRRGMLSGCTDSIRCSRLFVAVNLGSA